MLKQTSIINLTLLNLVFIDLIVSILGFFFPEEWYSFFHDASYIDPQGLLYRSAASWVAFFIVQLVALIYWKKYVWMLILVAGCRLGDTFTDITCLIFSSSHTVWAFIVFPLAGIGNLAIGVYLVYIHNKIQRRNISS